MSSGSSGRYQSKLFNFVDQRSRRLTNQLKFIFHNIRVAAIANTEALFSPLFHLWHRDASSRNLLPSPKNNHLPQLPAGRPPTDLPIKHLIETVENLPSGINVKPATSLIFNPLHSFRSLWEKFVDRFEVVVDYLFRLTINQRPLMELPQEVESKFIPDNQGKGLPQIERSPGLGLIDDDWLAWNDLFDQIKVKVNRQIQEPQHSYEIKAQPDWIEINARFLGYEKHPLERVLAWLDQILLTLEEVLKNCCFFFRGLLGG